MEEKLTKKERMEILEIVASAMVIDKDCPSRVFKDALVTAHEFVLNGVKPEK